MPIVAELRHELYRGNNAFDSAQKENLDNSYTHTNIPPELIEAVLQLVKPMAWLEIGSCLGGSAIRTAQVIAKLSMPTEIVCVDPFCADVSAWYSEYSPDKPWRGLGLKDGRSTLYERFLANVAFSEVRDRITVIPVTSTIGIKLLRGMADNGRISHFPSVIYLDSAHEPGETLVEINASWNSLPQGGVLVGDDWSWDAVRQDVIRFAATIHQSAERAAKMMTLLPGITVENGVMLYMGQWMMFK